MSNQFRAISLSHQTAPLAVREQVALSQDECKTLALKLNDLLGVQEALLVSTCNRTEVYYLADADRSTDLIKLLCIEKGLLDTETYRPYFRVMSDSSEAIRHLFEVATGLHSKVVGDMQIPNQIKQAYQTSADVNMAGPFLHRLMHTIFFTNKRVAQETSFRDGAASVSYATAELIETLTQNIVQPKVLIVGLGEIGTDVCKNLADKNFAEITVINRTYTRALDVAKSGNFRVVPFEYLDEEFRRADVVVSSVVKGEPLVTKARVEALNVLNYKYFIDLSVPRSIEPEVEEVPGVLVYNIDSIKAKADEALEARLAAIPHVEAIVGEAIAQFNDWSKEMVVSPAIQKLKGALEQIRKDELSRHLKGLSADEAERLERITSGIVQKILKLPVVQLKAACKRGDAENLVDVLTELFDLERQPTPASH
ncbi:MAG: glutamyl-tRNA reductase [Sphingobacteriaceae bacterium]|nr:glutamyl-tRNA reductase [Cytophagaceae bacterium]